MTAALTKELAAFHASAIRSVMQDTGGYNSRALQSAAEDMEMFASGNLVSVPSAELEALRRDRDRLNSADQLCKKFMHGTYQGYSWSDGHEEETPGFVLSFKKRGIRQAIDAAMKAKP